MAYLNMMPTTHTPSGLANLYRKPPYAFAPAPKLDYVGIIGEATMCRSR